MKIDPTTMGDYTSRERQRLSRTEWKNIFGHEVAESQKAWERRRTVDRMIECGLSKKEIAKLLGVGVGNITQMVRDRFYDKRSNTSPAEVWFSQGSMSAVAKVVIQMRSNCESIKKITNTQKEYALKFHRKNKR